MEGQLLSELLAGFRRFQRRHFQGEGSIFETLKSRQAPAAMIIACCDSRVDPALLTEARPGDVFVIRNVANLVPPYVHGAEAPGIRSAIEFGVKSLQVKHVIVLGHSGCGGVRALMAPRPCDTPEPSSTFEFVDKWMRIAEGAKAQVAARLPLAPFEAQCRACELESIKHSVRNLHSFPWVDQAVKARTLSVHGWYFDMESGSLSTPGEAFNTVQILVAGVVATASEELQRADPADSAILWGPRS